MFPPVNMSNYLLANLFHKSSIHNHVFSHGWTLLVWSFSLKIFQALANSTANEHIIYFKNFLAQQKQNKKA